MSDGLSSTVRRSIAVIGTHSPARSLTMAAVLGDCIERHGWSERLIVCAAGFGDGAGQAEPGEVTVDAATECPDVEQHPLLLSDAHCLVVGSEEDAELFLEFPGADGKQILAFADFADGRSDAITDRFSQLDLFCEEISDAAASLLRFLVARSV